MVEAPDSTQTTLAYQDNDIAYEPPEALQKHPANEEIYREGELEDDFIESVEKNGVLEPCVITSGKKLISGHRRREAAKQVGLDRVPVRYVEFEDEEDEILALVDFNRQREKTRGEKIREAKRVKEALNEKYQDKDTFSNLKKGKEPDNAHKEAADKVGISDGSVNKGLKALEAAESEDEDGDVQEVARQQMEQLDNDEQSYHGASENVEGARELRNLADSDDEIERSVATDHLQRVKDGDREARRALREAEKQIEKQKHERELAQQKPTLDGDTEFDVIVADPPWDYNNDEWRETYQGTVPYPTMSLPELKTVDVPAAEDSVLWLWFTNAFVAEAAELAEAWGFQQKTILTWDKDRLGLGHWLRNQTEHVMFCVRGSPEVEFDSQPTIFKEQSGDHSVKPERFYEIVEEGCFGSKLELFAREARDGWVAFGDEVTTDTDPTTSARGDD